MAGGYASYGGPCTLFPPVLLSPCTPFHSEGAACVICDAPFSSVASGQSWKTMAKPDNQVKDPAIAVGL